MKDSLDHDDDPSVVCPACRRPSGRRVASHAASAPFKCTVCGLVYTHPMPTAESLMEFYQGFAFQRKEAAELLASLPALRRSLRHFVGAPRGTARFLDYGGASGVYARAAQDLGWRAAVSDYDRSMLRLAREGLGVLNAFVEPELIDGQPYEVIFAFHVIEHWNDIDSNMSRLLAILAPGGRLVFATPNAHSTEKRVRTRHRLRYIDVLQRHGVERSLAISLLAKDDSITCWDPPRHLYAFTPDALRAVGTRLGLQTRIMTGYNVSALFEPRQYGIPPLAALLRQVVVGLSQGSRSRAWAALARVPASIKERAGLRLLAMRYPDLGEQLYVEYTKAPAG